MADSRTTSLQAQVDEQSSQRRYGWFAGVFRPTVMTILGVILFVREPWVIGNAGVAGGIGIITLGFVIVTLTALSMSCITTNLRIGAGGAYSIISQSLGLEVGGAVGIPLFLAQAFAGAMYIFGFREGLLWIFPDQSALLLDMVSFGIMIGIAFISTKAAFNVQYIVLGLMILGIGSSFAILFYPDMLIYDPMDHLWGSYPGSPENGFEGVDFWTVFAIFFPAATGILAGANMSGELKNPRKELPFGTMLAIAVSYVIYVALAVVIAMVASPEELVSNYNIALDRSAWPAATLGALLGATFSSGLACFVGAPRILQALADHGIFPGSSKIAKLDPKGEPKNALMLTGLIVGAAVLIRDLNVIAPMITMFFLITYMMMNLVVVVEQQLDMVSFRPGFPVWRWVPIAGTIGCLFTMFIINPTVGLIAVAVVIGFYLYLTRRDLNAPYGDMRSGLFVALAEWAAKHTFDLPTKNERAWRPSLVVPFRNHREMRGNFPLIRDLTRPDGSVVLLGLSGEVGDELERAMPSLGASFVNDRVFARWTHLVTRDPWDATIASLQTLSGTFFRPNILFMQLHDEMSADEEPEVTKVFEAARQVDLGVLFFVDDSVAKTGQQQWVNVWVRDQSPNWQLDWDLGNIDLELLTAYKLSRTWNARVRVVTAVPDEDHVESAREFLISILELARLMDFEIVVENRPFAEALENAPQADLDLFGLSEDVNFEAMRSLVRSRKSACLFIADSGEESILA